MNATNTLDSMSPYAAEVMEQSRRWFIGLGLLLIALGIVAISMPFAAALAVELLVGWLLVFSGIGHGVHAFRARRWRGFFLQSALAVLNLAVGLLLVIYPLQGVLALTLILAAFFIAEGIFKIAMALQLRSMSQWGWLLVSGVLAIVLGLLIWLGWPSTAAWAIGLLLGVDLVFGGLSLLMLTSSTANQKPIHWV